MGSCGGLVECRCGPGSPPGVHDPSAADHQSTLERALAPESEVKLDGTTAAFFVGPQNDEMYPPGGEVHNPGYLILVNDDGSFRTIKTKRMDMMRPAWSEHGLYFSDESSDYRLTESGFTKSENPKITAQNLMFALPGGGAAGVFNAGAGDGGYENQVAVGVDGKMGLNSVQGNYFTGAVCDGEVFGLTNMPGTHSSVAPRKPNMISTVSPEAKPQMLARLHPLDGGEKVIGWRPSFGFGTPIGQVPCHDGVISFLSWDSDAEGTESPAFVSWDSRTGKHRKHPLTFDDGTKLNFDDFGYIVQDFSDGRLHWVYADGRVFATDSATGKTVTLFDTKLQTGAGVATKTIYAFSDSGLHAISTTRGAPGNVSYTVFDRDSGEITHRTTLPLANNEVNIQNLNISHMAVKP
jgi:hypothetical protein